MKNIIFIISIFLVTTGYSVAESITIGGRNFAEQTVLGEIMAQLIEENTDITIERKFYLGGTFISFNAIKSGEIDLYPEYTGTAWMSILKQKNITSPEETYNKVKKQLLEKYNTKLLKPFGFDNTYAVAVRKGDDRFKGVEKISQLTSMADELKIAASSEMFTRSDGFYPFAEAYGLNFKEENVIPIEPGLMYQAIDNKEVDMIMAFSTDGRIEALNLRLLEDDRSFFPPYEAVPFIRVETLQKYPQIEPLLNKLSGKISNKKMQNLNYQVSHLGNTAKTVARKFLEEEGLIEGSQIQIQAKSSSLFAYFWNNKTKLLTLINEHMFLTGISVFLAIIVGVPLGILSVYEKWLENVIFTLTSIFQTIPSIALLGFFIPLLGIGVKPAIAALFLYALLPIVRNTNIGIKTIDNEIIESSIALGMKPHQLLRYVQLPLAMPTIMTGIRICSVIVVGTATICAFIGAGGLGRAVLQGIASLNTNQILFGAIPAAILAIFIDRILYFAERKMANG